MIELRGDGLSYGKVAKKLQDEGMKVSINQVRWFFTKEDVFNMEESKKIADQQILDSISTTAKEFQELYDITKRKMLEWESQPDKAEELLKALKLMTEQLTVAIKKLGFMRDIMVNQTTTVNNYNDFNMYIQDLGAKEIDGKVVIEKPKPELIELLRKKKVTV